MIVPGTDVDGKRRAARRRPNRPRISTRPKWNEPKASYKVSNLRTTAYAQVGNQMNSLITPAGNCRNANANRRFLTPLCESPTWPLLIGIGLTTFIAANWPTDAGLTAVAAIIWHWSATASRNSVRGLSAGIDLHGAIYARAVRLFCALLLGARLAPTSGLSGFAAIDLAVGHAASPSQCGIEASSSCLRGRSTSVAALGDTTGLTTSAHVDMPQHRPHFFDPG